MARRPSAGTVTLDQIISLVHRSHKRGVAVALTIQPIDPMADADDESVDATAAVGFSASEDTDDDEPKCRRCASRRR